MDFINPTLTAATTRLALGDVDDARERLRRAAHVDWVSDQAPAFRRELWDALEATYALEDAVRRAAAAAEPLTDGAAVTP